MTPKPSRTDPPRSRLPLTGRTALVTGSSRGIGAATARRLARQGARVAVHFRRRQRDALRVARAIERAGGRAVAIGADVSDPDQAEALVERAVTALGRLDLLVNNAGLWERGPLLTTGPGAWRRILGTNLDGVFYVTRVAARHMAERGRGSIVNVASTAGQRGEAFHGAYAASKGALIALTKSWAAELAPRGIRVNAVAPGWVETEMTAAALTGRRGRAIVREIPAGRVGRADEIATAIAFLAGDDCGFATGEILNVNGGAVLCG